MKLSLFVIVVNFSLTHGKVHFLSTIKRHQKKLDWIFRWKALPSPLLEFIAFPSQVFCARLSFLPPEGDPVDVCPLLSRLALDIVCSSALGRDVRAQSDPDSAYVRAVFDASAAVFRRMFTPWLWPGKEEGRREKSKN